MKLTVILSLIGFCQAFATSTYSQTTRLTFDVQNVKLKEFLTEIESASEFYFIYSSKLVDVQMNVTVKADNSKIDEILNLALKGSDIDYSIINKQIILSPKAMMKDFLETVSQQQKMISGKVSDSSGATLPGVSVVVKGTTIGVITDHNGQYSLSNVPENAIIQFSFVGMKTQEIEVGGKKTINVTLAEETVGIEEVVAVGYGTQRKATLTGSIASIGKDELMSSPSINVTDAIGGLMPGVITQQVSGEPGRDDPTILIRGTNTTGNNSPLIVVDGIQDASARLNSNEIESISVLKDASAAIYGARAANGVILITTKRGSIGKPTINYTFNQAITQPTRLPKMANSAEFAGYVNQLDMEAGRTPRFSEADIQKYKDGSDPLNYPNTDWYGAVLRKYGTQSQHNLSARGGSENIKYSISGTYTNQGSIFKNGSLDFQTYSVRSNVDAQITKSLKVGFDLNGSLEDGNYPAYDVSQTFEAMKQVPFIPVYWPNGSPSPGIEYGMNPIVMGTSLTGNENRKTNRFNIKNSFDLILPWLKGLGVDGYYAYSKNMITDKNWQTPWTVYDYAKQTDTYTPRLGGGILQPQLTQQFIESTSSLINLRIKFERQFNNHHLSTFIAAEQSNDKAGNFSAFRKNYISSTLDELFAGSLTDQQTNGVSSESSRKNLFGRVNYGFKDKYLLDFNFRYDGSSNFPKGKRYGFFPGASAAWRVSEENFMKDNLGFIDNLKVRASVGKIGNDNIAAFQYLRLYSLGNTGMSFGQTPVATNGLIAGVSPNNNITWEVAKTANIGMDASFWKGLFGFTVDLFKQTRSNILATRSLAIPFFTGLSLPNENIGSVENKGFELQLTHTKAIGDFSWRVAGSVSYSHNNVVSIDEPKDVVAWKKLEGHVVGATQYYHAIGIFRTQADVDASPVYPGTQVGDLKYEDKDKDGKITANDMYTMDKTSVPEVFFGLNLTANYKSFSLWANFAGAGNVWQYYHVNARVAVNNLEDVIVNRYTPGSMDSKYPRLPTIEAGSAEPDGLQSDFWLRNATYVRLKTLELSYNVSKDFLKKLKIQSARLFLNGQNLFTIDNVKWADPENTNPTGAYYPQSKIYNLGINLTF